MPRSSDHYRSTVPLLRCLPAPDEAELVERLLGWIRESQGATPDIHTACLPLQQDPRRSNRFGIWMRPIGPDLSPEPREQATIETKAADGGLPHHRPMSLGSERAEWKIPRATSVLQERDKSGAAAVARRRLQ